MPRYKFLANRALTVIENALLGTGFSELHTGYRAYSRELLLTVPFLRNSIDFVFDSEMVMQAVHFGFRIVEVPARTRYFPEASSASAGPVDRLRDQDARRRDEAGAAPQRRRQVTEVRSLSEPA